MKDILYNLIACALNRKEINAEDELDMDSLCMLDLVLKIEDEFKIKFDSFSSMAHHMSNAEQLVEYLEEVLASSYI